MEYGVSTRTQLSFMGLGLSRTCSITLAELLARDNLSEQECLAWLREVNLNGLPIPVLLLAEVNRTLNGKRFRAS
jgi:hypothetical protein